MLEYINSTTSIALIAMVLTIVVLILRFCEEEKSFFSHVFGHDQDEEV